MLLVVWLLPLTFMSAETRPQADCPSSPNCISTRASDPARRMPPLSYSGTAEETQRAIIEVITRHPRTHISTEASGYVAAEFTSLVFRFVDDVEFWIDPTNREVHFRSASRTGYSDLGANRRRMQRLCSQLVERGGFAVAPAAP